MGRYLKMPNHSRLCRETDSRQTDSVANQFVIYLLVCLFVHGFLIRDGTIFDNSLASLAKEIVNSLDSDVPESAIQLSTSDMPDEAAVEVPKVDIQKKPGRAFLHKLTGKFLAESGNKLYVTCSIS